ncbi:MAG: DNA repair protein RecO (recombination protein O) [Verrucomicrobia bacterium]|nr:MAG: DNA repair protein RecO (recombination protein O) [Verrucomicrobiota bacterium]
MMTWKVSRIFEIPGACKIEPKLLQSNHRHLHLVEKTMATLIRTSPMTETSLIVHWCSDEKGLIKTAAKGALRPASPFAGKLDLFFEAELVYVPSRGGDLHTLKEVNVLQPRAGIRAAYLNTLAAACFVRWVELVAERETPIPEIADLLRRGLDFLDRKPADLRALFHFERQLAERTGIHDPESAPAERLVATFGGCPRQRDELLRLLASEG